MSFTLTVADIKAKYKNSLLVQATDDNKTGSVNDAILQIAIDDAEVTLSNFISIDETIYGEKRLKKWWRDLAYYELFKRGEREAVSQDKFETVMREIKEFKSNISTQEYTDYEDGFCSVGEAILEEEDILKWGE